VAEKRCFEETDLRAGSVSAGLRRRTRGEEGEKKDWATHHAPRVEELVPVLRPLAGVKHELPCMRDRRDLQLERQSGKRVRLLHAFERAFDALEARDGARVVVVVHARGVVDDDEGADEEAKALEARRGRGVGVVCVEEEVVGGGLRGGEAWQGQRPASSMLQMIRRK